MNHETQQTYHQGSLTTLKKEGLKVQLITFKFYNSIIEVLNSFDFTVTMGGLSSTNIYLTKYFIQDMNKKYLRINRLTYPSSTLNRIYKYKLKGFYTVDILKEIVVLLIENDPHIEDIELIYMD